MTDQPDLHIDRIIQNLQASKFERPGEIPNEILEILEKLLNLQEASHPKNGDAAALGKDLRAQEALKLTAYVVRYFSGWALDHQVGLALAGMRSLPPTDHLGKEDLFQEARTEIDSHRHQMAGTDFRFDAHDPDATTPKIDGKLLQSLLFNLMNTNPLGLDDRWKQEYCIAMDAASLQDSHMFFPNRSGHNTNKRLIDALKLRAVGHVYFRHYKDMNKLRARDEVGGAYGVSIDTIKRWESQLNSEIDAVRLSYEISTAIHNAEKYSLSRQARDKELVEYYEDFSPYSGPALLRNGDLYRKTRQSGRRTKT
jgi:hypothetical protein